MLEPKLEMIPMFNVGKEEVNILSLDCRKILIVLFGLQKCDLNFKSWYGETLWALSELRNCYSIRSASGRR